MLRFEWPLSKLGLVCVSGLSSGLQGPARTLYDLGPDEFCASVSEDRDGDGFLDLLVGCQGRGQGQGRVILVSGLTGMPLTEAPIAGRAPRIGEWVAELGDYDGDGSREVGVCLLDSSLGGGIAVDVLSPDALERLFRFDWACPAGPSSLIGPWAGPDVDRDGQPDALVASIARTKDPASLRLDLLGSGQRARLGGLLEREVPAGSGDAIDLARIEDLDGDGVDEVVIAWGAYGLGGELLFVGSRTGEVLQRIQGTASERLNGSVIAVGDLDGGGRKDLLCSALVAPAAGSEYGVVVGYSTERHEEILRLDSRDYESDPMARAGFGATLARMGGSGSGEIVLVGSRAGIDWTLTRFDLSLGKPLRAVRGTELLRGVEGFEELAGWDLARCLILNGVKDGAAGDVLVQLMCHDEPGSPRHGFIRLSGELDAVQWLLLNSG